MCHRLCYDNETTKRKKNFYLMYFSWYQIIATLAKIKSSGTITNNLIIITNHNIEDEKNECKLIEFCWKFCFRFIYLDTMLSIKKCEINAQKKEKKDAFLAILEEIFTNKSIREEDYLEMMKRLMKNEFIKFEFNCLDRSYDNAVVENADTRFYTQALMHDRFIKFIIKLQINRDVRYNLLNITFIFCVLNIAKIPLITSNDSFDYKTKIVSIALDMDDNNNFSKIKPLDNTITYVGLFIDENLVSIDRIKISPIRNFFKYFSFFDNKKHKRNEAVVQRKTASFKCLKNIFNNFLRQKTITSKQIIVKPFIVIPYRLQQNIQCSKNCSSNKKLRKINFKSTNYINHEFVMQLYSYFDILRFIPLCKTEYFTYDVKSNEVKIETIANDISKFCNGTNINCNKLVTTKNNISKNKIDGSCIYFFHNFCNEKQSDCLLMKYKFFKNQISYIGAKLKDKLSSFVINLEYLKLNENDVVDKNDDFHMFLIIILRLIYETLLKKISPKNYALISNNYDTLKTVSKFFKFIDDNFSKDLDVLKGYYDYLRNRTNRFGNNQNQDEIKKYNLIVNFENQNAIIQSGLKVKINFSIISKIIDNIVNFALETIIYNIIDSNSYPNKLNKLFFINFACEASNLLDLNKSFIVRLDIKDHDRLSLLNTIGRKNVKLDRFNANIFFYSYCLNELIYKSESFDDLKKTFEADLITFFHVDKSKIDEFVIFLERNNIQLYFQFEIVYDSDIHKIFKKTNENELEQSKLDQVYEIFLQVANEQIYWYNNALHSNFYGSWIKIK
ncbi:hypothetical protein COBT_001870 [Conglomerata obtusa]